MIDRNEEMILEDGDHFEVRYTRVPKGLEVLGVAPEIIKKFVFQKDKDAFVTNLLTDECVRSIEVGTFLKIK